MSGLSQLLGNPNALSALLQTPQFTQPQGQAPPEAFADLPSLPALQQGAGAGGPLQMLAAALSGGGPEGAQPMDEVPRGNAFGGDDAPVADEDAPNYVQQDVSGVDEAASSAGTIPGLGPDLQANMGLGDQPVADEDAPGAYAGGAAPAGASPTGTGSVYDNRPVAPVLNERDLYPSTKRSVMQGVVPGIVALIAGLTGGKAAAAGLLQGAYRGNEDYNQQLKERGLLRYREAQQKFARDHQLWQDNKAKVERKTTIISALAEKARSFPNPADGLAWLRAQIPLYAALDINPMDAWGMAEVGSDERRRLAADAVVKTAVNEQLERIKLTGKPLDPKFLDTLPDTLMVTWDGKRQPLRAVMDIANSPSLSLPENATTTEKRRAVEGDIATSIESFTKRTGRVPTTLEHSSIERDAWAKYEHDKEMADQFNKVKLRNEILQGQHLAASTAALTRQAGDLSARDQQFARSRVTEMQKLKPYQAFLMQGSLRNQFISTYEEAQKENSGIADAALISEYVRFKHPGSSRVGDQEVAIVELARDGLSSIAQVVPKVFVSGAKLTATQRRQMLQVIDSSYDTAARGAQVVVDDYSHQLAANGVDPSLFIEAHHGSDDKPVMPYWARERVAAAQAAKDAADKGFAEVEAKSGLAPVPETPSAAPAPTPAPTPAQRRDQRTAPPPAAPPQNLNSRIGGLKDRLLGGPSVGDTRMINGVLAEWDGTGWLPVKR